MALEEGAREAPISQEIFGGNGCLNTENGTNLEWQQGWLRTRFSIQDRNTLRGRSTSWRHDWNSTPLKEKRQRFSKLMATTRLGSTRLEGEYCRTYSSCSNNFECQRLTSGSGKSRRRWCAAIYLRSVRFSAYWASVTPRLYFRLLFIITFAVCGQNTVQNRPSRRKYPAVGAVIGALPAPHVATQF